MSLDRQVKLWSGFEDGQRREVSLCASPQNTFYFRFSHDEQVSEIAVKPSELHRVLGGHSLSFENAICAVTIKVNGQQADFSFACTCLISFTINLNKLGLLLRGIGLAAPA